MRFQWYWPFARSEELDWAKFVLRPGEQIVVQVVDRDVAPEAGTEGGVTVVRDLPDVDRSVGRASWAFSRSATYRERAAARRRQWRSGDFDLVHLHYVNRFTDAISWLPHPLVMSVHDLVPHVPRLGATFERRLLARIYRRPDALVVHHPLLADGLREEFGVDPSKIHVVPHQVFPVGSAPTARPAGERRLLFFGALRTNKGLAVLGEAMKLLASDDVRLTIAGRGDEKLERLARDLAAADERINTEIGFATLDRKRELFDSSSLAVLPYTSFSSQSGVLHDAYGHGRPVVVTDVGALGASVRDDQTGAVVPPNDPAALAAAITRMLETDAWDAAAASCRRIATERSPEEVGRRLRELYEEVLR